MCLHGFTDTWRTWELVLPRLERRHDVLEPTLLGHAGAAALEDGGGDDALVDAVERLINLFALIQSGRVEELLRERSS